MQKGLLLILSGPSGVGKDTVFRSLLRRMPELRKTVSVTTRPARDGEVDGREYIFVDRERFEAMIEEGLFLEWADVHGNLYGTPADQVNRIRSQGSDVVLVIDVQGAESIRRKFRDALTIFLFPPSQDELLRRLAGRGTEDEDALSRRLLEADREMQTADKYDYRIVNENIDDTVTELEKIVRNERSCRREG